ncbi:Probable protein phosphatase 2C 62 (AtPP2C62) [Durusdinium trenchii]|uniref:Probable protein phosphatase 2C 62 (AtPP2C62) n=1 Tax=Durusdinium trenchii TaxID=1381693 RepID=A0ABP0HJT3_9DINO
MSGVQADGPQREDPAGHSLGGPALADLEHIKAAARLLEMVPAQALALTRIVEVLRAKIAIQSTRVLECWRVKTVMLASWERSQEIFANELQVLRAEDEDVSKNLMVWAETAAVRARTCALLGGFALLKRLGSLRVGGALQHWKALSALRQRKDPGLRNLARSLDHVVRTRLALAWARWQGWNQIRLSQWCHEQVQPEVEHLHGTPSSVSRRRGAQSPAAGGRSRVAARAEDLLRLKVRLAWRADFVQRCGLLKNEADRKRPTAEEVWMLRLDRGAACLLEYTLASAYRAQLRYAFNAMLAWATEMPSRYWTLMCCARPWAGLQQLAANAKRISTPAEKSKPVPGAVHAWSAVAKLSSASSCLVSSDEVASYGQLIQLILLDRFWLRPRQSSPGRAMADGMLRSPTFLVGAERQRKNLDEFKRREQQLAEAYHKKPGWSWSSDFLVFEFALLGSWGFSEDADACLTVPLILGVADGVSQIEDFGIDASVLPNELLNVVEQLGMHQLLPNVSLSAGDTYRGPVSMLRRAFEATESLGSLTVVLAIMDNSTRIHGKLHPMIAIITVGDCELLVLRRLAGPRSRLELVCHTEMQRIDGHAQTPLQLARVDDRIDPNFHEELTIEVIEKGSAVHCVSAYEGDIVIMGSDGVFDNLFLDEILDLANGLLGVSPSQVQLRMLAQRIVEQCHAKTRPLPNGALPEAPIGRGGKKDDTSCVVAEVVEWTEELQKLWAPEAPEKTWNSFGFKPSLASSILNLNSCCVAASESDDDEYDMLKPTYHPNVPAQGPTQQPREPHPDALARPPSPARPRARMPVHGFGGHGGEPPQMPLHPSRPGMQPVQFQPFQGHVAQGGFQAYGSHMGQVSHGMACPQSYSTFPSFPAGATSWGR